MVKPCTRCVFVNVDPLTAIPDPAGQPLKTLASYRRSASGTVFGQHLIPRSGGWLQVGDPLQPLA